MKNLRGIIIAILSSASFGLIPLFSIPLLTQGTASPSILFFRFAFGSLALLLLLLMVQRTSLRITAGEAARVSLLALLYVGMAFTLLMGYNYMPGGIATTLFFSFPVWTSLLMIVFFGEKFSVPVAVSIVTAISGVIFLSGLFDETGSFSLIGLLLEVAAAICYSVYMVLVPMLGVNRMGAIKLTFFIFVFSTVYSFVFAWFSPQGIQLPADHLSWLNLVLLGLLPTAFSNITLVVSIKQIGSTLYAILGAFEPFTAMCVGILVFDEPLTPQVIIGFSLILLSVGILIMRSPKTDTSSDFRPLKR